MCPFVPPRRRFLPPRERRVQGPAPLQEDQQEVPLDLLPDPLVPHPSYQTPDLQGDHPSCQGDRPSLDPSTAGQGDQNLDHPNRFVGPIPLGLPHHPIHHRSRIGRRVLHPNPFHHVACSLC